MKTKLLVLTIFCFGMFVQEPIAQTLNQRYTTFRTFKQGGWGKHWGWTPAVSFRFDGTIPKSSQVKLEVSLPNGKPWFSEVCKIENVGWDDEVALSKDCGQVDDKAKESVLTGLFGYKIILTDELQGINKTLHAGKLKVGKVVETPITSPEFSKHFNYYIDNDWRLPIGVVFIQKDTKNLTTSLAVDMWFKGLNADKGDFKAYLFYQGKKVAENGTASRGISENLFDKSEVEYYQKSFATYITIGSKDSDDNQNGLHDLAKNPGEYELKVTNDGKLIRSVKFSIGADGYPVDNGIAKNNNFGFNGVIVPLTIIGDFDGIWNKTAWQTEALWGNPLKGFTAIP